MSKALECLDKMRIVVNDEWGNIDKDKHDNWYGEIKKELKKIEKIKQLLKKGWNGYDAVDLIDELNFILYGTYNHFGRVENE